MKYLTTKNLLIAVVLVVAVAVTLIIYRMFFQFKSKDISIYIDEEAVKYGPDRAKVYGIIQDGVEHILASHNLTQQVLKTAAGNNIPKEQVLVHAAIMQCQVNGYIGEIKTINE